MSPAASTPPISTTCATTVRLAKAYGVAVGAHPSLPDLQGFGRREMKIGREELANCLDLPDRRAERLSRRRGHDRSTTSSRMASLYGMAARVEDVANAVCDAADVFKAPLLGMVGTLHEKIYPARGHRFIAEFYADLDYNDDGGLIITREHEAKDPGRRRIQVPARDRRGQGDERRRSRCPRRRGNHLRPFRHAQRGRTSPPPFAQPSSAMPSAHKPEEGTMSKQILSPLPGTFYRQPAPDKPPFKAEGDTVAVGDVIGLIEVMKSFIEVHADTAGKHRAIRRRQRRAGHGGPAAGRGGVNGVVPPADRQSRRDRRAHPARGARTRASRRSRFTAPPTRTRWP